MYCKKEEISQTYRNLLKSNVDSNYLW